MLRSYPDRPRRNHFLLVCRMEWSQEFSLIMRSRSLLSSRLPPSHSWISTQINLSLLSSMTINRCSSTISNRNSLSSRKPRFFQLLGILRLRTCWLIPARTHFISRPERCPPAPKNFQAKSSASKDLRSYVYRTRL
jgi:hypothetical protein